MERTPLVAGNWKMFKTARRGGRVLRRARCRCVDELDEVDLALCPPFTALDVVAERDRRRSASASGARTCTRRAEGAFTGEVSCAHADRRRRDGRAARPLRAARAVRRDRRGARREARRGARRRARAGALRRRERGRARRRRDRGAPRRAQLDGGARRRSSASQVAAGRRRLRAGLGDRHGPQRRRPRSRRRRTRSSAARSPSASATSARPRRAHPLRRLRQARQRRARCSAQPDVDGALVGGASLDPASFAAIAARRCRLMAASRSRSSCSTASARARRAGQRRRARARRRSSTRSGRAIRTRTLTAAGRAVGLPEGQMGNSEVGHLNIGAGRVVRAGSRARRRRRRRRLACRRTRRCGAACAAARAGRGVLHVAGLVSDGGVHSHVDHLRAIVAAALAARRRRASPCTRSPTAATSRRTRRPACSARSSASGQAAARAIATVIGRYYAMDRDHRAERTERARAALVDGVGRARRVGARRRSRRSYAAGVTDEFVEPIVARRRRPPHRAGRPARLLQLPPRPRPPDLPRAAAGARACS